MTRKKRSVPAEVAQWEPVRDIRATEDEDERQSRDVGEPSTEQDDFSLLNAVRDVPVDGSQSIQDDYQIQREASRDAAPGYAILQSPMEEESLVDRANEPFHQDLPREPYHDDDWMKTAREAHVPLMLSDQGYSAGMQNARADLFDRDATGSLLRGDRPIGLDATFDEPRAARENLDEMQGAFDVSREASGPIMEDHALVREVNGLGLESENTEFDDRLSRASNEKIDHPLDREPHTGEPLHLSERPALREAEEQDLNLARDLADFEYAREADENHEREYGLRTRDTNTQDKFLIREANALFKGNEKEAAATVTLPKSAKEKIAVSSKSDTSSKQTSAVKVDLPKSVMKKIGVQNPKAKKAETNQQNAKVALPSSVHKKLALSGNLGEPKKGFQQQGPASHPIAPKNHGSRKPKSFKQAKARVPKKKKGRSRGKAQPQPSPDAKKQQNTNAKASWFTTGKGKAFATGEPKVDSLYCGSLVKSSTHQFAAKLQQEQSLYSCPWVFSQFSILATKYH